MTSLLMTSTHNKAARIGLTFAALGAAASMAWWIRHGAGWVVSSDLFAFPGPWQWAAAIALLAAVSGTCLVFGWKNATDGDGDDAKVFGGIFLTAIAVVPLFIQALRYFLWGVLFLAFLVALFGRRRR